MITYDHIGNFLKSTEVLSDHYRQLRAILDPVLQLIESIDKQNTELARQREKMYHDIKSVEAVGEFLKQHVFKTPDAENMAGNILNADHITSYSDQANTTTGFDSVDERRLSPSEMPSPNDNSVGWRVNQPG